MASYELPLTESELLWLLDHTSIFTPMPQGQNIEGMCEYRLKLLSGLGLPHSDKETSLVTLVTDELWISLETAKFAAQMGTEKVGLNLIHKLGEALLAVSADAEVHSAVIQCGEGDDEPVWERDKLRDWKEGEDAKAKADERNPSDALE